ncbi:ABC transporter permease subunit [Oharaeibacter diazotrophicus]|uniref:Putative spermidine/putrescine transport system permease protein n=1 Tax=Oharaeibacter diazotrophicus TaxID=1920512 RepID=A0A4R6RMA2_9HYPH|nr:ABC transporter permease subunit [Oharaeibacter diazotrophicus]TDP86896.1 putative spermidine/putrescine transport system permease protein [Oharaeibacter diazotrophicus]BBE71161.1 putrescine transporter subunit: membrane component of ABC superfamily protein [Pleomorphomonas sp. SM30]GLS77915.1 hypothetical protein GCM10007904_32520 [Oharaeibacter diazotrophicus]
MRRIPTAVLLAPALAIGALHAGALGLGLLGSVGVRPFGASAPSPEAWSRAAALPGLAASVAATLWVAAVATAIAVVLGVAAALALRSVGRTRAAATLVQANLALPHVVAAVGALLLLGQSGLVARIAHALGLIDGPADFPALTADPQAVGAILAYAVKEAPFVAAVALARLAAAGDGAERAARGLGAGPVAVLRHVTLPMLTPAVAGAAAVAFAFALGAYEIPAVLGASRPKLVPVLAYELFVSRDVADRPVAVALAIATAAVALAVVGVVGAVLRAPAEVRA